MKKVKVKGGTTLGKVKGEQILTKVKVKGGENLAKVKAKLQK